MTPWLLLALVVAAVPFWWLLVDTDRGDHPPKPLHIADLRVLAHSIPGPRPTTLACTVLATRLSWGDVFAAGIGLQRRRLAIVTWSLAVPGKGPIIIDPGAPPPEAGLGRFGNFDGFRQRQIDEEARNASLILFTQSPKPGTTPAPSRLGDVLTPAPPLAPSTTAQAVAPGVVVIPAASHAPGAQLIFVQLADGHEYLFAGTIAMLAQNWTKLRARSHLAALLGPAQNRYETYAWLRTIRQLRAETPDLRIVPGHDGAWLSGEQTAGAIAEFQPVGASARRNLH